MVCELIALGCIVAHGDITEAAKLKTEWSADTIIKTLEELHPEFYPQPSKQEVKGPGKFVLQAITSGFLTKTDLLTLNGKCGSVLHRGNFRKLLSSKTPLQTHFPDIDD